MVCSKYGKQGLNKIEKNKINVLKISSHPPDAAGPPCYIYTTMFLLKLIYRDWKKKKCRCDVTLLATSAASK